MHLRPRPLAPLAASLAASLPIVPLLVFQGVQVAQEAQGPGAVDGARSLYERAFTLEEDEGALEPALELYRRVAGDPAAPEELRRKAQRRAEGLVEELASARLVDLVPADAIVYVELSRPGERLRGLLEELGLLASTEGLLERGSASLAISPDLVDGLVGMRGAAIAVTELPLDGGAPGGVLVVDPGELELLRGFVETALPAGGTPVEPIAGRPTWSVEDELFVTLGSRLLVASSERRLLEALWRRLEGDRTGSLGEVLARAQEGPTADDLLYLRVDAEPVRPMLTALIEREAARDPGARAAAALLDVEGFESFEGRLAVGPDGLALEMLLALADDHQSVAFDLLGAAALDPQMLARVPAGAAAFVASAWNPRGSSLAPLETTPAGREVVTIMDLGRELFGNVTGIAAFALPPEGAPTPIPDAALVVGTNDPARSQVVWGRLVALAELVSNGGEGDLAPRETIEVEGAQAARYAVGGVPLYLASTAETLVLSPSRLALERALSAGSGGGTLLSDGAFAERLRLRGGEVDSAGMVHLGRSLRLVQPYLDADLRQQLEPLGERFDRSVLALSTESSTTHLGLSLTLDGVPDIGDLVAAKIAAERERQARLAATRSVAFGDDPVAALEAANHLLAEGEGGGELHRRKFDLTALELGDEEGARAAAQEILEQGDPLLWNNHAWWLLTEERYGRRFDEVALELARAANDATGYTRWEYLDTLALALFRAGRIDEAIEYQETALRLVEDPQGRRAVEAALTRFRAAQSEAEESGEAGPPA